MFPFDAKTYNQKVLAPMKGEKPDEFARYCLEISDDDTEQIRARLADVRSHWRNNSTAGGAVGQVIKALMREHSILEGQLGDGEERRRLRERLQAAKAEADAARWTRIDRALNDTHRGHGGIPDELRVDIVQLGEGVGLTAAEVERHIDEVMRRNGMAGGRTSRRSPVSSRSRTHRLAISSSVSGSFGTRVSTRCGTPSRCARCSRPLVCRWMPIRTRALSPSRRSRRG